jgi:hypothetical protein
MSDITLICYIIEQSAGMIMLRTLLTCPLREIVIITIIASVFSHISALDLSLITYFVKKYISH